MSDQETMDTKVAVMQNNMVHFAETMKEFKVGQDKMQESIEGMSQKLDVAYQTKADFMKWAEENFKPIKSKVDNLVWWLALLIGGGGSIITLVNWYLLYRHN